MKARRRLVCECVAHLRHKLVAHRHKQVRTLVDEFGKRRRHVLHVLVLKYERRELMLHDGSRLRLVCQFARHDVALEEARAIEHVERSLDERGRRSIALAYRLALSATYMAQAAQDIVHKQQARHLYRHIGTIFVRVELRAAAVCLMSRLPFVRAFQIHGELLAASEGVALHQAEVQSRTHTPRRLSYQVALKINVVWLVEHAVEREVERVARCRSVARSERKVDTREESLRRERVNGLLIVLIAV